MRRKVRGGMVFTPAGEAGTEYLPNKGVFLTAMLGRARGDAFGLYLGRIEPGCGIEREIHASSTETVYVIAGSAVGMVAGQEIPLSPGEVLHVEKDTYHGLRNTGSSILEVFIIGCPDF
jgi:quercetin dioxygenase-like cupin family protein